MMHQALSRRFSRGEAGESERALSMPGMVPPDLVLPDLVLVDGGKGQLNIALEVLKELGVTGVEVRALAKDRDDESLKRKGLKSKGERVFIPNVKEPILLKEGSRPDLLVRRIRDEVHRFAISYHRKLRSKEVASLIDRVPGIGEKKKKALFERFGDLDSMVNAPLSELLSVPGITEKLANEIKKLKGADAGEKP